MKKLLIIIIIITLPTIAFFQYSNYRRYHPPVNYDYPINAGIDANYYDQNIVKEYYKNAIDMGQLARTLWFDQQIDVRFPKVGDTLSIHYSNYYAHLKARNEYIEGLLLSSAIGKAKGWSNEDIKLMERGINPEDLQLRQEARDYLGLTLGDQGPLVSEVQEMLLKKGYSIPIDGVFGRTTENALKSFQEQSSLPITGQVTLNTYVALKK